MSKTKSQFLDAGDDASDAAAAAAQAAQGVQAQAQQAVSGVQSQAQQAANQATATATTAVTSALSGAGVPPGITSAATGLMDQAAQQGFSTVVHAIGSIPGKIFHGLFHHHHKKIHDIPQVAATIAALPPDQKPGAIAAANLIAANLNGATPPANMTPTAQAAYLVTHGLDSGSTPAQNAAVMTQVVANGGTAAKAGAVAAINDKDKFRYLAPAIGAIAVGGAATLAGLALLPAVGIGAAGAGLVYMLRKKG